MADNHNMKKAIEIIMKARALGIIWRLILQIILDRPSAIVNAWANMNKRPDLCPAKILIHKGNQTENIYQCRECLRSVAAVGNDDRCGRCNPTLAG
jgi:hypothetical protein